MTELRTIRIGYYDGKLVHTVELTEAEAGALNKIHLREFVGESLVTDVDLGPYEATYLSDHTMGKGIG